MIEYDEALEIARKLKTNIDACDEYETAFVFKAKADEFTIGGDGPCCVLKKDGKAVGMTAFIDGYASKLLREIEVK